MNHFTRPLIRLLLVLAGAWTVTTAQAADGDVASPTVRQEALDKARKLLAPRESTPPALDPFHSEAFDTVLAGLGRGPGTTTTPTDPGTTTQPPVDTTIRTPGPRSTRDLLQSIAAGLKPSSYILLGGQPILFFGQKRVKAGGTVTITFEGTEYTLEVSAINHPNFTLRLNREEFTRPIK